MVAVAVLVAATTALHPALHAAFAVVSIVHEGHPVEKEGLPPFVASSPPTGILGVWLDLSGHTASSDVVGGCYRVSVGTSL